jgi:ATP-binding cassette, subfamily F, member 3
MAEASGDDAHVLGSRYAEVSHRFDTLGGFSYQVQAKAILLGLGFEETELDKPVQSLSGGQKTRAALARLLLLAPDVLLLDEPTNHLDIQATDWLETFLREKYQGAALIVSHDRYFLDRVVSKVMEIEDGIVSTYPGNYSAFARLKAERIEEQRKLFQQQKKEIARLEEAIQTLFSHRKFSRRDSKVKELERIEKVDRVRDQRTISAHLSTAARSGREVLRLSGLAKSYPGQDLFSGLDLVALRGRKIGIVGPNGSGKTTLLKIIADREAADAGEVAFGHRVQPVYFAQEFDHLVPTRTVLEELLADADLTSMQARDLLAQFLFIGDDAFKKVEVLSGGELCRLALAKVVANAPNLLLLDEPTNHLDIRSREALEDALRAFTGTILVASHDRYLLDAIPRRYWRSRTAAGERSSETTRAIGRRSWRRQCPLRQMGRVPLSSRRNRALYRLSARRRGFCAISTNSSGRWRRRSRGWKPAPRS